MKLAENSVVTTYAKIATHEQLNPKLMNDPL